MAASLPRPECVYHSCVIIWLRNYSNITLKEIYQTSTKHGKARAVYIISGIYCIPNICSLPWTSHAVAISVIHQPDKTSVEAFAHIGKKSDCCHQLLKKNLTKYVSCSLKWCHKKHNGVSNQRRLLNCLLNRLLWRRLNDIKAPRHWPVWEESPHKGPVTLKMFPFEDPIMYDIHHNRTS